MYVVSSGSDDLCAYVVAEFRERGNCVMLARVDRKWTGYITGDGERSPRL